VRRAVAGLSLRRLTADGGNGGSHIRILVAEDDVELARTLAQGLRQLTMAVDLALDGSDALDKLALNSYNVVILDRDLPLIHGDEVCRWIAEQDSGPRVLMLTAAAGLEYRVEGLEIGADDYLPKPFAFAELVARIHALARRPARGDPPVLRAANLTFYLARRRVERAGVEISLTTKEYAVLDVLMRADGAVVSAEELLERAWDENVDPFTATVRVTIANLRSKLGDPPIVETLIGSGYRIKGSPM
jgi:DNA-binding response OmpR family regulator